MAQIPNWKEAYEEFKNDKRFVMVGLSLDRSKAELRRVVRTRKMNWIQDYLGDWSKSKLPSQYAVSFLPTVYLIGPAGTLIDNNLRVPKLQTAIEKALKNLEWTLLPNLSL